MRKIGRTLLAVVAVWVFAAPASAAVITFDLDVIFSGATPSGDLHVTITDIAGGVQISFDASELTGNEFVTEWNLNLNPDFDQDDLDALDLNHVSGIVAKNTGLEISDPPSGGFKADGDGYFDLAFLFNSKNSARLGTAGDTSVYELLGAVTTADFLYPSVGGEKGGYYSAAHVQGIPIGCSGWIGDPAAGQTSIPVDPNCGTTTSPTTTPTDTTTSPTDTTTTGDVVPEPTLLTLLGGGMLLAGRRLRRRNK